MLVFCDFDGTMVDEQYVAPLPRKATDTSLVERNRRLFQGMVRLPVWGMKKREGVETFLRWCSAAQVQVVVLSNGDSRYVRPQVAAMCDVEAVWVECLADKGSMWGSKAQYVTHTLAKERGVVGVYVGDGLGDYDAAMCCDHVFARDALATVMWANGRPFVEWADFDDVLAGVKEIWEKSERVTTPT